MRINTAISGTTREWSSKTTSSVTFQTDWFPSPGIFRFIVYIDSSNVISVSHTVVKFVVSLGEQGVRHWERGWAHIRL